MSYQLPKGINTKSKASKQQQNKKNNNKWVHGSDSDTMNDFNDDNYIINKPNIFTTHDSDTEITIAHGTISDSSTSSASDDIAMLCDSDEDPCLSFKYNRSATRSVTSVKAVKDVKAVTAVKVSRKN